LKFLEKLGEGAEIGQWKKRERALKRAQVASGRFVRMGSWVHKLWAVEQGGVLENRDKTLGKNKEATGKRLAGWEQGETPFVAHGVGKWGWKVESRHAGTGDSGGALGVQ